MRLADTAAAVEIARSLAELAAEHGFSMWSAQADALHGEALIALGRFEEGIEALRQAAAAYESTGAVAGIWRLRAAIGYAKLGSVAEGLEMIARTRQFVEEAGLGVIAAETYRVHAELIMLRGSDDAQAEAESLLRRAVDTAQRQHAQLYELRATVALARLLESTGRRGEARAVLTVIYHWFCEGFDIPDLREARELLERLTSTST